MNVLLVEPDYYTRYPSLGLLKLGTLHKAQGDAVQLVRGIQEVSFVPDRIDIASLFTWDWQPVWRAVRHYKQVFPDAEVRVPSGIYASNSYLSTLGHLRCRYGSRRTGSSSGMGSARLLARTGMEVQHPVRDSGLSQKMRVLFCTQTRRAANSGGCIHRISGGAGTQESGVF